MTRSMQIILVIVLTAGLVAVRMFEAQLFYDPLLEFFKTDHTTQPLPEFSEFRLLMDTTFRFVINTLLSLTILWVIFRKTEILKLSGFLYLMLFLIAMTAFFVLIRSSAAGEHMALFYVRRFLIQPVFLLILIPAFYFQKKY
jgi:exosortase F-associated protein